MMFEIRQACDLKHLKQSVEQFDIPKCLASYRFLSSYETIYMGADM